MTDWLRFQGVSKAFSGRPVLRGLQAEIPLSGITFVVGQSGAGKSVLSRLAVGMLQPDDGNVELLGERVNELPARARNRLRRQVPYLVQGPALLDWLTLEQNVALAGGDAQAVAEALRRVGLSAHARAMPTTVGPGTRKRAAIARALVLSPRYVLFDEPTTGLDRAAAKQVTGAIAALKAEGVGALVVSHDYRSLRDIADHVLWLDQGQAAFQGSTSEFLRSTAPGVRALLEPGLAEVTANG